MTKVMIIGDYHHGLSQLMEKLAEFYDIYPIAFMDFQVEHREKINPTWHLIDFRDFHELTIRTMDFEPDIVIYLPYMIRPTRALNYPDLADMANVEAVEHLRETIGIHNSQLILLQMVKPPKMEGEIFSIVKATQKAAIDMVTGMSKLTVVKVPEILDHSPKGALSWAKTQSINEIQGIRIKDLSNKLIEIIDQGITGEIGLEDTQYKLDKIVNEDLPQFSGDSRNFNYLKELTSTD